MNLQLCPSAVLESSFKDDYWIFLINKVYILILGGWIEKIVQEEIKITT